MADHRLRLPSSYIGAVANLLASKLGTRWRIARRLRRVLRCQCRCLDHRNGRRPASAKGRSLVICGSQQPPEVQALVAQINESLGNQGHHLLTIALSRTSSPLGISDLADANQPGRGQDALRSRRQSGLQRARRSRLRRFPDAPSLLAKVEQVIRLGLTSTKPAPLSTTHLPAAHFLESWGDSLAYDSATYLCQQPLILPLYDGISELELLAALAGLPKRRRGRSLSRKPSPPSWAPARSRRRWPSKTLGDKFVHDGFDAGSHSFPMPVAEWLAQCRRDGSAKRPPAGGRKARSRHGEYELNFVLGNVDDGRYANNGWLQELPDPISKLTWDNALYMSPKTAAALGIKIITAQDNLNDLPNTDVGPRALTLPIPQRRSDDRFPDGQGHHARWPQHGTARPHRARPGRPDADHRARLGPHRAAPDQGRSRCRHAAASRGRWRRLQRLPASHLDHARLRHRRQGREDRQDLPARHHAGAQLDGRPRPRPRSPAR